LYGLYTLDIDNCMTNNGGCEQVCINTEGAYACECRQGYTLTTDLHTCQGRI